jgi:circadian clock protein KaiB
MTSVEKMSGAAKAGSSVPWKVRLYIAGWTAASVEAVRNVKVIEAEYLPPGSTVEIIDLLQQPEAGRQDHVLAIPTVVRVSPAPVRRMIGSLSDLEKTLKVLEIGDRRNS